MTIEENLFKKTQVNLKKLTNYGFKGNGNLYEYSKNFLDDTFKITITVTPEGKVKGQVYDLSFNEEYTNFRLENINGSFSTQIKEQFINTLNDIKNNCFEDKYFIYDQTNRIAKKIKEKYNDEPNFEWDKYPDFATFKNQESQKWYCLVMNINQNKLDQKTNREVEIINVKLKPSQIKKLLNQPGFYKAYHMNKDNWITILLDNTISDNKIMKLIEESYISTSNNISNEWIIPANPHYFDIEKALQKNHTITWKQSTNIKINDIIYLYVASPIKEIKYKFKVLEVDIPHKYQNPNLKIQKIMKISLITTYQNHQLSFAKLKEFGVTSIRGPRHVPTILSKYINDNLK